jgi:DNA-binding transcriptional ArsR family regulator
MLAWLAGVGGADAVTLATAMGLRERTALAHLRSLEQAGLVDAARLLHRQPALFLITRDGLCAAGRRELDTPRVTASSFAHLLESARTAVALQCALAPRYSVHSERELRVWERDAGHALASADVGPALGRDIALHRPDLVCWPVESRDGELPIAIEVELTVKGALRLRSIVRAWARCRHVEAVVYYASAPAARAVNLAIAAELAEERVHVLALERRGDLAAGLIGRLGNVSVDESQPRAHHPVVCRSI